MHENQHLDASYRCRFRDQSRATISTAINLVAAISGTASSAARLGFFNLSAARSDPLYFGTANGTSNSTWGIAEVDYLPWLNVKLGLQYTALPEIQRRHVEL